MGDRVKHQIAGLIYYIQIFIAYLPSHFVRKFLLIHLYGLKISKTSALYHGFEIRGARKISIGEKCIIGNKAILDGRYGLIIGDNVNLGTRVTIWTAQHDYNSSSFEGIGSRVEICDYVWIASEATIMPGVIIGEGAVIAAKSLVTKNVNPYSVVAGIPAKEIAQRNKNLSYDLSKTIMPYV